MRLAQEDDSNLLELNVVSFTEEVYNIQMFDWDWPKSKLFEWTLSKTFPEIQAVTEASLGSAAISLRRESKKYIDSRCIDDPSVLNKICKEIEAMLRKILAFSKVRSVTAMLVSQQLLLSGIDKLRKGCRLAQANRRVLRPPG
jgi:hypothetical protein